MFCPPNVCTFGNPKDKFTFNLCLCAKFIALTAILTNLTFFPAYLLTLFLEHFRCISLKSFHARRWCRNLVYGATLRAGHL